MEGKEYQLTCLPFLILVESILTFGGVPTEPFTNIGKLLGTIKAGLLIFHFNESNRSATGVLPSDESGK